MRKKQKNSLNPLKQGYRSDKNLIQLNAQCAMSLNPLKQGYRSDTTTYKS